MAFNPGKFLREVRTESAKIVWPTRRETLMTGLMVVIMTSLLALFFFARGLGVQRPRPLPAQPGRLGRVFVIASAAKQSRRAAGEILDCRTADAARNDGLTGKNTCPAGTSSTLIRASRTRSATRSWPRPTGSALTPLVESVEVPTEKVTEVRRGKKVTSDRKFFPGYVLAKLQMNDDVYHLVKNTPKVTGFLGSMGKPQPISDAEAARILNTREEAAKAEPKARISVDYEIGDAVKVLDGPFASFNGVVEELDFEKSRVKVSVSIFGRATPVELEFEQVERVK